jgi:hypothetical protein
MKIILPLLFAVGFPHLTFAQETRAHIPYKIPDGTPPPPQPAKPVWIVSAEDVISEKSHAQGGRTMTVREIKPIALPPPAEPAAPVVISEELRERIDSYKEKHPLHHMIGLGATIYRLEDQSTRTHIRVWLNGHAEPVGFWSSGDFSLLSGIGSFTDNQGVTRAILMSWSIFDIQRTAARMTELGRQYTPPEIPELPADRAAYVVSTGNPDDELLTAIDSLHEILNDDAVELRRAYEGRVLAARERQEFLKANPPQPEDLIINHWRIQRGEGQGK